VNSRKFLPFVLTLLVLSLIAGCAAPAAPQAPAAGTAADAGAAEAAGDAAPVTLTYLVDDSSQSVASANALVEAYTALNPNVTINVETRPQGADGDNFVKTRLATGEMADIFAYNSGSLLQALQPAATLVDITNEPYIANIAESFLPTVSQDGKIYGVPAGTAVDDQCRPRCPGAAHAGLARQSRPGALLGGAGGCLEGARPGHGHLHGRHPVDPSRVF
jgi:ABC-type glycerol-3-phosphate transport system substrate-binding protein